MSHLAYCFVDGGYLRELAWKNGKALADPARIANQIVGSTEVQAWAADPRAARNVMLARIIYYDAKRDEADKDLEAYWDAVEMLRDTELGFGSTRGGTRRRPPRQKGVDTLIAVDMLVGAFTGLFQVAVLLSGDADFVPVVNEVRRRGVMVVLAAHEPSLSDDLRRAADRFVEIDPEGAFPPMRVDTRVWNPPAKYAT